jgi:8-oxo-dGTP pyrophosphatase MutT (NUDIX family)
MQGAAADLVRTLKDWPGPTQRLAQLRQEYVDLVGSRGVDALRREGGSDHVTASCFVFSADLQRTLLCFHRKGRFWVQTGGHVEAGDGSIPAAALREAREESGIAGLRLVPGVLDLDRHELSARFGACRTHWDVGFAALTTTDERPRVSEESEEVAWFPVDDLPTPLAGRVADRLAQLRDQIRASCR